MKHRIPVTVGVIFFAAALFFCALTRAGGALPEKTTFVVISDPHFCMISKNDGMKIFERSGEVMEEAIREVNAMKGIDFVVILGDLFKDNEVWNLDRMREMLDELKAPYYVIFGNHDAPIVHRSAHYGQDVEMGYSFSKSGMVSAFQGHGYMGTEYWWSAFPNPWLQLIGLDTSKVGTWGGLLPSRELKWLNDRLSSPEGKKLTIVLAHHNLTTHGPDDEYREWKNFHADNADEARKVLEAHRQVKLVITGHHHIADIRTIDGIHYIACPSLLTYPCKYTKFTVTPEKVDIETIAIHNGEIIREALEGLKNDKSMYPPSTADKPLEERIQASIDLTLDRGGLLEDDHETLEFRR